MVQLWSGNKEQKNALEQLLWWEQGIVTFDVGECRCGYPLGGVIGVSALVSHSKHDSLRAADGPLVEEHAGILQNNEH